MGTNSPHERSPTGVEQKLSVLMGEANWRMMYLSCSFTWVALNSQYFQHCQVERNSNTRLTELARNLSDPCQEKLKFCTANEKTTSS